MKRSKGVRYKIIAAQVYGGWLVDEANRLDAAADAWTGKPDSVADIADMDDQWVLGTLGPDVLRRHARDLRVLAAKVAKSIEGMTE